MFAAVDGFGPLTEPIDKDVVKDNFGIIEDDTRDIRIERLIRSAREAVELYTERRLISQTLDWSFDRFPSRRFEIPSAPVTEITSIKYYDTDDSEQTIDVADYRTKFCDPSSYVETIDGWPSTKSKIDAVTIRFVVGYADQDAVRPLAIEAMLMLIGHWLVNPEAVILGTISSELPLGAKYCMRPLRIRR